MVSSLPMSWATGLSQQGGLKLNQGGLTPVGVIALQLLGEQGNCRGERLGIDAQLPDRTGTLQGATGVAEAMAPEARCGRVD